jgi:hypothetical protein
MKAIIIRDDTSLGDLGHDSEQSQRDYEQQISDAVLNISGSAVEVWGGWVWMVNRVEQHWSKRTTRHQCERIVYQVVERLGETEAFDLEDAT